MNQATTSPQEEWLKILGKGMVTLPKKWRDALNLQEGDVIKAKKKGDIVILESPKKNVAPYRIYTTSEINDFLKEDKISDSLRRKVEKHLAS